MKFTCEWNSVCSREKFSLNHPPLAFQCELTYFPSWIFILKDTSGKLRIKSWSYQQEWFTTHNSKSRRSVSNPEGHHRNISDAANPLQWNPEATRTALEIIIMNGSTTPLTQAVVQPGERAPRDWLPCPRCEAFQTWPYQYQHADHNLSVLRTQST